MSSVSSGFISSNPVRDLSFLAESKQKLTQAFGVGAIFCILASSLKRFNLCFQDTNTLAFIPAALCSASFLQSVKGVYLLGCRFIGPREDQVSDQANRPNTIKRRIWTVIRDLEKTEKKVDEAFSRLFQIRTAERINRLDDPLTVCSEDEMKFSILEKLRKVFKSALEDLFNSVVSIKISGRVIRYFSLSATSTSFLFFGFIPMTSLLFLFNLHAKIDKLNEWIDLKKNAMNWIQIIGDRTYLESLETLDLTMNQELTRFNLEQLLPLCPNLKILELNVSDLPNLRGITVDVPKNLNVKLSHFSSSAPSFLLKQAGDVNSPLQPDEWIEIADEEGKTIRWPLYREALVQFPTLNYGFSLLNKEGIDRSALDRLSLESKQSLGIWLNAFYTGVFPFHQINSMSQGLQSFETLVGKTTFSDSNLTFFDSKKNQAVSFPLHQKLLKANSTYFQNWFQNNGSSNLNLLGNWRRSSIELAVASLYEGVIDERAIEDDFQYIEVLALMREWKINDFKDLLLDKFSRRIESGFYPFLKLKELEKQAIQFNVNDLLQPLFNQKERLNSEMQLIDLFNRLSNASVIECVDFLTIATQEEFGDLKNLCKRRLEELGNRDS